MLLDISLISWIFLIIRFDKIKNDVTDVVQLVVEVLRLRIYNIKIASDCKINCYRWTTVAAGWIVGKTRLSEKRTLF